MRTDLAREWLASEGYKCDEGPDGGIHFKFQGKHMFITSDEGDEQFFRIIMPNIYDLQGNRAKVLEACNDITGSIKVVKAFIVDDSVWLSIEMFIDSTPEVGDFFERCCDILVHAYQQCAYKILN